MGKPETQNDKKPVDSETYVSYYCKRVCLIESVLARLSRKQIVEMNKTIRSVFHCSIYELAGPSRRGARIPPDSFDWRNDPAILHPLFFKQNSKLLIAIVDSICTTLHQPPVVEDICDKEQLILAYQRPETFVCAFAIANHDSIDNYYDQIRVIVDSFKTHHIDFPLPCATREALIEKGLPRLEALKESKDFPRDLTEAIAKFKTQLTVETTMAAKDINAVVQEEVALLNTSPNTQNTQKENTMTQQTKKYLGYLRLQKNFYNFYPVAEIDHGLVQRFEHDVFRERFPSFGAFSLVKDYYKDNATRTLIDNHFYTLEVDPEDLIRYKNLDGTYREDYRYQFQDFHDALRHGRFKTSESEQYFMVVYPVDKNPDLQSSIPVSFNRNAEDDPTTSAYQRIQVVLAWGNQYLGPTTLLKGSNDVAYVNFRSGLNDGVVHCFNGNRVQEAVYSFSIYSTEFNTWFARDILDTTHREVRTNFFDLLDDNALLQRLAEQSKQFDKNTLPLIKNWLNNTTLNEDLLGPNEAIREERKTRLLSYISHLQLNEENVDTFAKVVSNCLSMAEKDKSGFFNKLVTRIAETPQAMEKLKEHKLIVNQLDVLGQRKEELEKDIKAKTEELSKLNDEQTKKQQQKLKGELAKVSEARAKEEARLQELMQSCKTIVTLQDAEKEIERLDARRKELQHNNSILEEEGREVERHLKSSVTARELKTLAFNPVLAQKFAEAAALWAKKEDDEQFTERLKTLIAIAPDSLEGGKRAGARLVQYLYSETKRYRDYDYNTILNLYILFTQSLLTVFSGRPGSGKTSICHIMAHVLGLTALESRSKMTRFLPVAVERGWTSKRDFLGYFNPLTKQFESPDPRRYEAVRLMDAESREGFGTFPFLMLLDEANLSPMEYYWADFMNAGLEAGCMNTLSLGDGELYRISPNLRFVATINNDQTTESLSPRLIDRAWIVTLPEPTWENLGRCDLPVPDANDPTVKLVDWASLRQTFSKAACLEDIRPYEERIHSTLSAIYKEFAKMGLNPSARTQRAIFSYVAVATKWFEKEADQAFSFNTAIDYAVLQKLLPAISLVGAQYDEPLKGLKNLLESNDLAKSANALDEIINQGEASMNLYSGL